MATNQEAYRIAEVKAIGAKEITSNFINQDVVTYPSSLKTVQPTYGTMDYIIKSIETISRNGNIFVGTCVHKNGYIQKFCIDVDDKKIQNFCSCKTAKIDENYFGSRLRIRFSNLINKSFTASNLIACLSLLARGYVVDNWNIVKVNHMDNSAGVIYSKDGLSENIKPDNLELYIRTAQNSIHGDIWNTVYESGIKSSFSLYNTGFILYIQELMNERPTISSKDILRWTNKRVDEKTGIVYFN